jgi:hypothetical protein
MMALEMERTYRGHIAELVWREECVQVGRGVYRYGECTGWERSVQVGRVYRLGEDWTGRESIQVGRGMYRLGE